MDRRGSFPEELSTVRPDSVNIRPAEAKDIPTLADVCSKACYWDPIHSFIHARRDQEWDAYLKWKQRIIYFYFYSYYATFYVLELGWNKADDVEEKKIVGYVMLQRYYDEEQRRLAREKQSWIHFLFQLYYVCVIRLCRWLVIDWSVNPDALDEVDAAANPFPKLPENHFELLDLCVLPGFQRRNYGGDLIDYCISIATEAGLKIKLEGNVKNRSLYDRHHFRQKFGLDSVVRIKNGGLGIIGIGMVWDVSYMSMEPPSDTNPVYRVSEDRTTVYNPSDTIIRVDSPTERGDSPTEGGGSESGRSGGTETPRAFAKRMARDMRRRLDERTSPPGSSDKSQETGEEGKGQPEPRASTPQDSRRPKTPPQSRPISISSPIKIPPSIPSSSLPSPFFPNIMPRRSYSFYTPPGVMFWPPGALDPKYESVYPPEINLPKELPPDYETNAVDLERASLIAKEIRKMAAIECSILRRKLTMEHIARRIVRLEEDVKDRFRDEVQDREELKDGVGRGFEGGEGGFETGEFYGT